MFLPYTLQTIQPLKVLFLQDEFSEIPTIKIKSNSDIGLITTDVASLSLIAGPVQDGPSQIANIFDDISGYVDDSSNILRLQTLEYTSKTMANVIEGSYETLNVTIANTVDDIRKNIDTRYVELMKREKAEGLIAGDVIEANENDYSFLDWGRLTSSMIQNEVIDAACTNAGIRNPSLSLMNLGFITKKCDFSNDFKQVTLPKEVYDGILGKLKSVLLSDDLKISETDIEMAWGFFTDKTRYSNFCSNLNQLFDDVKHIVPNCMRGISFTTALQAVGEIVPKIIADELNAETLKNIASNIETVNKTSYAVKYWLIANEQVKFKDKLILTEDTLNTPVYKEFVQDGKTVVDIHNYLKAYHLDAAIPQGGIGIKTVMLANSVEKLEAATEKLRENSKAIRSRCLIGAYEHGIRKFLYSAEVIDQFPQLAEKSFSDNVLKIAMIKASKLNGDVANIDNVLYDLVIQSFYENTLTATLYKSMDMSYDKLITGSTEDINNNDILEAQCFSVSNMLVDYLFDTIVEKG